MEDALIIRDLHVRVEGKPVLRGVDLTVRKGEIHALMGPNGSGKTTLAYVLMGHPAYSVDQGEVLWKGQNILELPPDERAHLGLFLAFQYPVAVPGVTVANFLRAALNERRKRLNPEDKGIPIPEFRKLLREKLALLGLEDSFAARYVNDGFSGGEKKRLEILQMAVLQPEMAILDETDSGLDIDGVRTVAEGINRIFNPNMGILLITHYQRILNYIKPHFVHVMYNGRVVASGGPELALELEEKGYEWLREQFAEQPTS
ncbi:Fe-S cluster assembly ATPase SufC [Thermoflexus sp.]|uniref:Fe-S cluster assembly ATPase SufC n=1 Tax=Thermoflexus sp. TaxID=1969742 RepID=UPI002ADE04D9|nr:Fe-S cluster assembly ATPase SufC [Thermoflexus sp.]